MNVQSEDKDYFQIGIGKEGKVFVSDKLVRKTNRKFGIHADIPHVPGDYILLTEKPCGSIVEKIVRVECNSGMSFYRSFDGDSGSALVSKQKLLGPITNHLQIEGLAVSHELLTGNKSPIPSASQFDSPEVGDKSKLSVEQQNALAQIQMLLITLKQKVELPETIEKIKKLIVMLNN